jgi:hypothetical protein
MLRPVAMRVAPVAQVHQQLRLAQPRVLVLRIHGQRRLGGLERTLGIAPVPAIRRQDQVGRDLVGTRAGRLRDHLVGTLGLAADVVEACQCEHQLEVVLVALDALADHRLGLVEAVAGVVEAGQGLHRCGDLLLLRELDGPAVEGLGLWVAVGIHRQETRQRSVSAVAGIGLHPVAEELLGGVAIPLIAMEVREQQERLGTVGLDLEDPLQARPGLLGPVEGRLRASASDQRFDVVRVAAQQVVDVLEDLLEEVPPGISLGPCVGPRVEQKVGEQQPGFVVGRVETDRLLQLPVRPPLAEGQIGLGQAEVGHHVVGVDLEDVLELDDGLGVLLLLEVRRAAGSVVFQTAGVVGATNEPGHRQDDPDSRRALRTHGRPSSNPRRRLVSDAPGAFKRRLWRSRGG